MKKLLGLTALSAVLVLSACGGDSNSTAADATVCTASVPGGQETTVTATEADGSVSSVVMEMSQDVSGMTEEEIEATLEIMRGTDGDGLPEGMSVEHEGDSIVTTWQMSVDDFVQGDDRTMETFVTEMENSNFTCS